jgi:hypothetical protein
MLIFLITLAWLAIVVVSVAACRAASRADMLARGSAVRMAHDRIASASGAPASVMSVPGLTVWDCPDPIRLRSLAATMSAGRAADPLRPVRARRLGHPALRGSGPRVVRGRRGHFVAGS